MNSSNDLELLDGLQVTDRYIQAVGQLKLPLLSTDANLCLCLHIAWSMRS
jgi:hypothetical protein